MIDGLEISQQEVVEVPRCMSVKFSGSIDSFNLKYYNQKIDKIIDGGFVNLIFDLGQLPHFSSAWDCGIGVLKKVKLSALRLMGVLPNIYIMLRGSFHYWLVSPTHT